MHLSTDAVLKHIRNAREKLHARTRLDLPTFSILSVGEARGDSVNGRRAELLQEYIGYIQRVGAGEAGRLTLGKGETTQAIRRRLNAAAEALGRGLDVRRTANAVYFWPSEPRRRGRPRKSPAK